MQYVSGQVQTAEDRPQCEGLRDVQAAKTCEEKEKEVPGHIERCAYHMHPVGLERTTTCLQAERQLQDP